MEWEKWVPLPKEGRQFALPWTWCWGWGELGKNTPQFHSHSSSFVLILELGTGVHRFYFFLRAPGKNPIPCSNAPVLLCFSEMCFHLKTTFNGALLFSRFKN